MERRLEQDLVSNTIEKYKKFNCYLGKGRVSILLFLRQNGTSDVNISFSRTQYDELLRGRKYRNFLEFYETPGKSAYNLPLLLRETVHEYNGSWPFSSSKDLRISRGEPLPKIINIHNI